MNKLILIATILASSSAVAQSMSYQRGYDLCVDEANQEFQNGLVLERFYLVHSGSEQRTYYLNGTYWDGTGERAHGGIACTTDTNGRQLVSVEIIDGRFVQRKTDPGEENVVAEVN